MEKGDVAVCWWARKVESGLTSGNGFMVPALVRTSVSLP